MFGMTRVECDEGVEECLKTWSSGKIFSKILIDPTQNWYYKLKIIPEDASEQYQKGCNTEGDSNYEGCQYLENEKVHKCTCSHRDFCNNQEKLVSSFILLSLNLIFVILQTLWTK